MVEIDGIEYNLAGPSQFWLELEDIALQISRDAPLDEFDFKQRTYITLAAHYHDEYLQTEHDIERCVSILLHSRLFQEHPDRMTDKLIETVLDHAELGKKDSSAVVFLCMITLEHRGAARPHVFRLLKNTHERETAATLSVIHVMMDIIIKHGNESIGTAEIAKQQEQGLTDALLPARERLGLAATRLLYEVCRVSRLSDKVLALFEESFIERLFFLVESTRDGDEVFNFTLVRLIIALNEQFMVASLNSNKTNGRAKAGNKTRSKHSESMSNGSPVKIRQRTRSSSQPPEVRHSLLAEIEPLPGGSNSPTPQSPGLASISVLAQSTSTFVDEPSTHESNIVLKVITIYLGEHKTFGENLIYMLNRCEATAEDQCVALLILKILYLLFTTPRTHEYFYTNDLCVLIDVFLRGLNDLPEESEGLRHTFLRVLYPLMTNTQLKTIPYKRVEIRKALLGLVADCHRRQINATTRRLVERNLKAPWSTALGELPDLGSSSPTLSQQSFAFSVTPSSNETPKLHRSVYKSVSQDALRRRGSTTSLDSMDSVAAASNGVLSSEDKIAISQTRNSAEDATISTASLPPSSLGLPLNRPPSTGSIPTVASGRRRPPSPPQNKKKPLAAAIAQSVANVTAAGVSLATTPIRKKPPRPERKGAIITATPESVAKGL